MDDLGIVYMKISNQRRVAIDCCGGFVWVSVWIGSVQVGQFVEKFGVCISDEGGLLKRMDKGCKCGSEVAIIRKQVPEFSVYQVVDGSCNGWKLLWGLGVFDVSYCCWKWY